MTNYEVDGTGREKECDEDSSITHLAIVQPSVIWTSEKIIEMIENKKEKNSFWSYHYKNGIIDKTTKIKVEVVDAPDGKYLRTRKDETEDNNLLELPTWYQVINSNGKKSWKKC